MKPDNLVYMANQIGKFFQYQRESKVVPGIAGHIRKFWDPRMRTANFAYLDQGGEGLDLLVKGSDPLTEGSSQGAPRVELPGHLRGLGPTPSPVPRPAASVRLCMRAAGGKSLPCSISRLKN